MKQARHDTAIDQVVFVNYETNLEKYTMKAVTYTTDFKKKQNCNSQKVTGIPTVATSGIKVCANFKACSLVVSFKTTAKLGKA